MKIIQKREGYRFSIDAILLADFTRTKKGDRIVDLGTGSGVIPLILSRKNPSSELVGVEMENAICDMARRSVEMNKLAGRINIVQGDIKDVKELFPPESFDSAVTNPPYGKLDTGRINPQTEKAAARHEITGNLDDFMAAASCLVKFRGRITVIYPAKRLADLIAGLRDRGFEPKRMRMVHSREGESARLVLIEGVKGGGVEMEVLKPLYIYGRDGSYTSEVEEMYR